MEKAKKAISVERDTDREEKNKKQVMNKVILHNLHGTEKIKH